MRKINSLAEIKDLCDNEQLTAVNEIVNSLGIINSIDLRDYPALVRLILTSTQEELFYRYYIAYVVERIYLKKNNTNNVNDNTEILVKEIRNFDDQAIMICKDFAKQYFEEYMLSLGFGSEKS